MNKPDANNPSTYEVQTGEVVTIRVESFGVAPLVKAALDGQKLAGPPFQFTVSKPAGGIDIVSVECDFPPEPASGAKHVIYVSGSQGGQENLVTTIYPETTIKSVELIFLIYTFRMAENSSGSAAASVASSKTAPPGTFDTANSVANVGTSSSAATQNAAAAAPAKAVDFDAAKFFEHLSASSKRALNYAAGLRKWMRSDKIHMEHLIAGLYEKPDGPTRKLLNKAGIDEEKLRGLIANAVGTTIPPPSSYSPENLAKLPKVSGHVRDALIYAQDAAGRTMSSTIRSRHLLYGALYLADCRVIQAVLDAGVHPSDIRLQDEPLPFPKRKSVIAGVLPDTASGEDLLNIKRDVEVLCSVLAAKDVAPPIPWVCLATGAAARRFSWERWKNGST